MPIDLSRPTLTRDIPELTATQQGGMPSLGLQNVPTNVQGPNRFLQILSDVLAGVSNPQQMQFQQQQRAKQLEDVFGRAQEAAGLRSRLAEHTFQRQLAMQKMDEPEFRVDAKGNVTIINPRALRAGDFKKGVVRIEKAKELKPQAFEAETANIEKMFDIKLEPEEKASLFLAFQDSVEADDITPFRTVFGQIMTQRATGKRQERSLAASEERQTRSLQAMDERQQRTLRAIEERRTGSDEDAEIIARRVATGELPATSIGGSPKFKAKVFKAMGNLRAIPKPVREQFAKLNEAESIVDQFESTLEDFVADKSAKNAFRLSTQRKAFARKIGRALGEVGVFTDQDKQDFARLLSPGGVPIAAVSEDIAHQAIQDIRDLFNRVRQRAIQSSTSTSEELMRGATPQAGGGEKYPEGTIIRNPKTGERKIRKGGQWVPLSQ